jgi:alpha-galactosidase
MYIIPFSLMLIPLIITHTEKTVNSQQQYWQEDVLSMPYGQAGEKNFPTILLIRQDYEELEFGKSVIKTPMKIGSQNFQHGLGTHSISHIRVYSPDPIKHFSSWIGVDNNVRTQDGNGSVTFSIEIDGKEIYHSKVFRGRDEPEKIDIDIDNAKIIDLKVGNAGDGPACDHANWAEAKIITNEGKSMYLDELRMDFSKINFSKYPFSFTYGQKLSDEILDSWKKEISTSELDKDRTKIIKSWTDSQTGLKITFEAIKYNDYPALDWVIYLENTGDNDTPIIKDLKSLDITLNSPISGKTPYILHKTNGSPSDPTDFEVSTVVIDNENSESMGGGGGRSSNKDFPFFKVESKEGSYIIAVGWSGQWQSDLRCIDNKSLNITAGLEKTNFLLHPKEKVRSPRMLIMYWDGDTVESNAQFRQLIYKHYTAERDNKKIQPILFCNTCFTRGGGWLNECNAENQISLIKAYAPLGLEALITDAGWFEGGWPAGAGNWNPRKDAYPDGMGPVALSAKENGMVYGLWFEPERVVAGTWLHKNHPEWLLSSTDHPQDTYLLNFALPEVREYMFNIVKGFMELTGFRFYRQDFNMDPLPYWRYSDLPDRQGISEMKYIEGLYEYWDMIAEAWQDSIREECASGGRRIDLETIMRMHIHQKTDYWFDDDVDQASLWGMSQYLPNSTFVAHLNRMDDYSFHSTLASSLCMGWITDAPDFDFVRGKKLLDLYLEVRHLLIGAWYPLLPYTRDKVAWMASQYHRDDLQEGIVLAFRHSESPYKSVELSLRSLDPNTEYKLIHTISGEEQIIKGFELMKGLVITIPEKRKSELIIYRKKI